jgi:hypothetical protein
MKSFLIAMLAAGGLLLPYGATPALAQGRSSDPNIGHFYMARQQWQVLDDAPQIYDKRSDPSAAPVNQQSGLPRGPAPLPRAGFMPYSSALPSGMGAGLPQVVNGVPKKLPAQRMVAPRTAKAGAYKMKPTPRPSGPVTAKTYAPYGGYGGGTPVSTGPTPGNGNYGQSGVSSSTGVKGNLLHWSRSRPSY